MINAPANMPARVLFKSVDEECSSTTSTEGLIRVAVEYDLISDYRLSPTRVVLHQGSTRLSFDPEDARFFLQGLIVGYERTAAGALAQRGARFGDFGGVVVDGG